MEQSAGLPGFDVRSTDRSALDRCDRSSGTTKGRVSEFDPREYKKRKANINGSLTSTIASLV